MDKIVDKLFPVLVNKKVLYSLIVIICGVIIYKLIEAILNKASSRNIKNEIINKKKKTYLRLLSSVLKYIIIFLIVVIVFGIYGVNVTSIVAGLGVVSVIVGLALQDALKDIIMGFNIIVDEYFKVGDILKIGDVEGKVIELGLKATKMRDIKTGNIFTTANRNISEAIVLSKNLFIDVPLPYEEKKDKCEKILSEIVEEIKKISKVEDCMYLGIQTFGDSAIFYKIKIIVDPEFYPQVRRNSHGVIKTILDDKKISIPYLQVDVHNK